jgi:uncharacterized protein
LGQLVGQPDFDGAKAYAFGRLERELLPALTYHSIAHTRSEVLPAVETLAAMAGIAGERLLLLRTAAVFHDIGFIEQREGHEAAGVAIMQAALPGFGYSPAQVKAVADLVMTTRLPQTPQTLLEELLADADLDLLGRESYWQRHLDLRAEWAAFGLWMTDLEWYQNQLSFLAGHAYWSPFARELRDAQKQSNIRGLQAKLAECEAAG